MIEIEKENMDLNGFSVGGGVLLHVYSREHSWK